MIARVPKMTGLRFLRGPRGGEPDATRARRARGGVLVLLAAMLALSGATRMGFGEGFAPVRGAVAQGVAASGRAIAAAPEAIAEAAPAPQARLVSAGDARGIEALIEALAERETALDAREAEIAQSRAAEERRLEAEAAELTQARAELRGMLGELEEAEARLDAAIARASGAAEDDLARLTSVYETMKPKDAAALFETMEPGFSAGFLGRMRPEAAAEIMAGMSPSAPTPSPRSSRGATRGSTTRRRRGGDDPRRNPRPRAPARRWTPDREGARMIGIVGIVVVIVMVFGGYTAAGGHFDIILKSLPFEMTMIGGAALGAFLISNDLATVKQTMGGIVRVFKGVRWKHDDYRDVLCLLFELLSVARANPVELEGHIEAPMESEIFKRYPRLIADAETRELICDTFRSALMNYDDPHQVEEVLEKRIEAAHHHALIPSHALQTVADGLPALGIVAACSASSRPWARSTSRPRCSAR